MSGSFMKELDGLREHGLYRRMLRAEGAQGSHLTLEGRDVLVLCSNNYLGLADHPALKEAAIRATERYGTGSGASRLVSGNMVLHEQLEARLAAFKNTEAALVFNSGYAANTGLIPALAGSGDLVFSDRLNHASIVDGCLLSRARMIRYPHRDVNGLHRLLERNRGGTGRKIIITDGVFSMDGDIAPLPELVSLKREYGALLMVDDAHGTGVLGPGGRGTAELCGLESAIDIHMGTLGKALGGFGAYVAASREIVDYLVNRARSFIFSTSLPPSVVATALAALDIVDSSEGSSLRGRLLEHAGAVNKSLRAAGFDTMDSETQILPLFVGGAAETMEFSRRLLDGGIFVQGIRPPTVPRGGSRLRLTLMATHRQQDLERAVEVITATGKQLGII
jgi:glycine C-acetyltransferase